jgi:hypothetical protein
MICVYESCGETGLRLAAEKHVVVTLIRGVEGDVRSMSAALKIEGILMQIREKLKEDHVKLWLPPYCTEDGVTCEEEIHVTLT